MHKTSKNEVQPQTSRSSWMASNMKSELPEIIGKGVLTFNFLCLILNENLSWKTHYEKISNNISESIAVLNKLKHFLLKAIRIMLYNSMKSSHVNYYILSWVCGNTRIMLFKLSILASYYIIISFIRTCIPQHIFQLLKKEKNML